MRSFAKVFVTGSRFFIVDIFSTVDILLTISTDSIETGYGHGRGSKGDGFGYIDVFFVGYVWDGISVVGVSSTKGSGSRGARIVSVIRVSGEYSVVALSYDGSTGGTERDCFTVVCLNLSTVIYHGISENAGVLDDTYRSKKICSGSSDGSAVCCVGKLYDVASGIFYDTETSCTVYLLDGLFSGLIENNSYSISVSVGIPVSIVYGIGVELWKEGESRMGKKYTPVVFLKKCRELHLGIILVGGVDIVCSIGRIGSISGDLRYPYGIFSCISLFGYIFDIGIVIGVWEFRGLDVVYLKTLMKIFYHRYPDRIAGGFGKILEGDKSDGSEDDENGNDDDKFDEGETCEVPLLIFAEIPRRNIHTGCICSVF